LKTPNLSQTITVPQIPIPTPTVMQTPPTKIPDLI